MPSLRDIRGKIKSVKNTQQITKAMKMVAAARLRRAQASVLAARPFADRIDQLMRELLSHAGDFEHPLARNRGGEMRVLLAVTSDKGLCGAFNTNIIREAVRYVKKYGSSNVRLIVIGRKGRDYFNRSGIKPAKDYVGLMNKLSFAQAVLVAKDLLAVYDSQPIASVDIIFNEFKSVVLQKVVTRTLLPVTAPVAAATNKANPVVDFIFEPGREYLLAALMLRAFKAQLFRILLESSVSELGARMSAMENASSNARDLIGSLTLQLNRTRQASITKEILEVVGGAEALK